MLTLSETTDAIEVVLAAAHTTNALRCTSSWRDITTSAYTPGRTVIDTNGVTAIDAVTGPAASTQRVIDTISIVNTDTVSHQVTVKFDANGTEYILKRIALGVQERLEYTDRLGWKVYSRLGTPKEWSTADPVNPESPTAGTFTIFSLGKDYTNSLTTTQQRLNLRGLAIPLKQDRRYFFRFMIKFDVNASTTGAFWSIMTDVSWSSFAWHCVHGTGASAVQRLEGGNTSDLGSMPTSSASSASNLTHIEGHIYALSSGLLWPRFSSEVAGPTGTVTAKRGSVAEVMVTV